MSDQLPGELEALRDVCARFERAAIPFMLTGSLAMNYYAEPRMTRDIDIVVELEPADAGRVVRLFETGYHVSQDDVAEALRDRSSFNLIEQASAMKVDVFPSKRDHFRETEFARRRQIAIGDFSTWIVTVEDLVLAKLLWARASHSDVQLGDVRTLLRGDVDRAFIETWVRTLALDDLWGEVQLGGCAAMRDTTAEMAQRYREMLFARSPAERFVMGAGMFETARAMVLASFPPDLSVVELRRRLFARLYGDTMPRHLVPEALRQR